MVSQNLDEWVDDQADIVQTFRKQGGYYEHNFPIVPNEVTNWLDELRATVETCALADLSHHMTAISLVGSETLDFLSALCVNDFTNFEIGQAKQSVMCSHDGYIMGDGPLLRLSEDEFYGPGMHATKWLKYNSEVNEFDVRMEIEPPTPLIDDGPENFVYQVHGPNTHDVLRELTDDTVEDVGFYRFKDISVEGMTIRAFGHSMSPHDGYEFHGPFEYAEDVENAIINAGRKHGLKKIGSRVYVSNGRVESVDNV